MDASGDGTDEFEETVLGALVEGYEARAGAKERFQALSEYELARRVGIVEYSYVAYDSSPERETLRSVLGRLQRKGLVRSGAVAGRYETFLPTEEAARRASPAEGVPSEDASLSSSRRQDEGAPLPNSFEGRLDEIVRLLRSIDERLRRLERS